MRDLNYRSKSFRLSDKVLENLELRKGNKSWNILFEEMLCLREEKAIDKPLHKRIIDSIET